MSKIIMNNEEYVSKLKQIAERKTKYWNKYPYNLLYVHKEGYTSGDCLNTIKALLNGYNVNNMNAGYYQRDLSNTGDISEPVLLSKCTDISSDFDNLVKGELLYMRGHVGSYVGRTVRNSKEYNVIECTKSFGGGVVYSWVDEDGTRRSCKGGVKNGKWVSHGKMTQWIAYQGLGYEPSPLAPPVDDKSKAKVEYYSVKKGEYLSMIAGRLGISQKKLLELNPEITNPNLIYEGQKIRIK